MITLDGIQYVTASEAHEHLGADITPTLVRVWANRQHIHGHRVGRNTYYRLSDLIEAEWRTRTSRAGRRRTRSLHCGYVPIASL